jgi:hypothetical protein
MAANTTGSQDSIISAARSNGSLIEELLDIIDELDDRLTEANERIDELQKEIDNG